MKKQKNLYSVNKQNINSNDTHCLNFTLQTVNVGVEMIQEQLYLPYTR